MLGIAYFATDLMKFEAAEGKPRRYRKELVHVGKFEKDGQGFEIDTSMLHHWASTFSAFLQEGIRVPLPLGHTENPEARRGSVEGMEVGVNSKGLDALFGIVEFADEQAERLAKTADVSIYVPPSFKSGTGRLYHRPITHVALTDYPVVPVLGKFEAICASLTTQGALSMSMSTLAEKLGISVADKDEAQLEAEVGSKFADLQRQITDLQAQLEAPDDEEESDNEEEPPVAAGFVNMARELRIAKIDKLVTEGRITTAVATSLKTTYCGDKSLALSLGKTPDNFDDVIKALAQNEPVPLKEKTGGQTLVLSREQADQSPLIRNAKARAERAKGRR